MKTIISPKIEEQMKLISDMENLKECLEVRLALLHQGNALKSEYEQNESEILRMKTEIQLNKLNDSLEEKLSEFQFKIYFYVDDLEEEELEVKS
jgi:hypothetical protein